MHEDPPADRRAQPSTAPPAPRRPRRFRASTLLNPAGVIAAAVAVAALEPKLPHYVGD